MNHSDLVINTSKIILYTSASNPDVATQLRRELEGGGYPFTTIDLASKSGMCTKNNSIPHRYALLQ
jgi:hypothetical protein